MLTPESRSEICGINQAFAVQFARELANRPCGQWFDPVVVSDSQKERKYEASAPYLARQKERTLAHETELREVPKQRSESLPPPSSKRRRRAEPRRRPVFPELFFGWLRRTSTNGTAKRDTFDIQLIALPGNCQFLFGCLGTIGFLDAPELSRFSAPISGPSRFLAPRTCPASWLQVFAV